MVGAQRARTHAPKDDILDRIPEDRVGAVEALFEVLKETHRRQQTKRDGAAAAKRGRWQADEIGPKVVWHGQTSKRLCDHPSLKGERQRVA